MSLPAQKTAEPVKEPRISKRMRQALRLIATGECKTQKAAAARAGLSERHFSRFLQKAEIQVFIARESRRTIATAALRASNRMVELMDAQSEHVSAHASERVLAINGIRPPNEGQVSVNVGVSVGYVIDLSGRAGDHASAVPVVDGTANETDQRLKAVP